MAAAPEAGTAAAAEAAAKAPENSQAAGDAAAATEEKVPLPPIRRLRVCLLGGTPDGCAFQTGVGKSDVASALLRGLTADRPGEADPILDLAFDYGVFERAWWELLKEVPEDSPVIDRWGLGPLSVWDVEGRLRYDRRGPGGEGTPPFESDPAEECASLCAGSAAKLHFGHKRSPGILRAFRESLIAQGQDVAALEAVQQELHAASKERPRELVRLKRPCPGLLAAFARFSPEVGDLPGCGVAFIHVFEPDSRPLGSQRNVAMLYAAAPNSWTHRGQAPGNFLLALTAAGSNIARLVREYNRLAADQPAPEAWERAMWWQNDLRAQVEYYFCDKSLRTERYFREAVVGKEDGWLDMETVKAHPRMVHCGVAVPEELLDALKDSKCVDTKAEDGKGFVRRAGGKPLPNLEEPRKRRYGGGEVANPWAKRRQSNSDDPTCWDFVRRGVCPRGDRCKYVHAAAAGAAPPGDGVGAAAAAAAVASEATTTANTDAAAAAAAAAAVVAAAAQETAGGGGGGSAMAQAAAALGDQIREAGLLSSSEPAGAETSAAAATTGPGVAESAGVPPASNGTASEKKEGGSEAAEAK